MQTSVGTAGLGGAARDKAVADLAGRAGSVTEAADKAAASTRTAGERAQAAGSQGAATQQSADAGNQGEADRDQPAVLAALAARGIQARRFFSVNALSAVLDLPAARMLAARPDVAALVDDEVVRGNDRVKLVGLTVATGLGVRPMAT